MSEELVLLLLGLGKSSWRKRGLSLLMGSVEELIGISLEFVKLTWVGLTFVDDGIVDHLVVLLVLSDELVVDLHHLLRAVLWLLSHLFGGGCILELESHEIELILSHEVNGLVESTG